MPTRSLTNSLTRSPAGGVTGVGVLRVASALRAKVLASYSQAQVLNSVSSAPHGSLPDWAATTTYKAGEMVKAGGFSYIMAGNTSTGYGAAGTSGGVNPFNADPVGSGQDRGYISDGTCAWMYRGVAQSVGSTPLVSTAIPTTSSDPMNGYVCIVANTAISGLGLTNVITVATANASNGDIIWYTGGPYSNTAGHAKVLGPNAGSVSSPNYASSQIRPAVSFDTDATRVAFQPFGPLYDTFSWLFEVNGRLLSERAFRAASTVTNSSILLDLTSFGAGVKRVRVFAPQSVDETLLRFIAVNPGSTVSAPQNNSRFSIAFEGDSITQGSAANPLFNGLDLACQTARLVGCDSWYNNAQGGTGFIANNAGSKTTYAERLDRITQFAPDILIIGGNHNDITAGTSGQRQAAILSYLQAVRAALPQCVILASGGHLLQSESAEGANPLALEADMSAAVAAFADPRCQFVPVLTDAGGSWITGAGTGTSPQGNGNKDLYYWKAATVFNDSHPVSRFYDYVATKYAAAIVDWAT